MHKEWKAPRKELDALRTQTPDSQPCAKTNCSIPVHAERTVSSSLSFPTVPFSTAVRLALEAATRSEVGRAHVLHEQGWRGRPGGPQKTDGAAAGIPLTF